MTIAELENLQHFITILGPFLLPITIWTIIWKGIALWKAGKNNDRNWFIAILIINSIGLLDIIYIYLISKRKNKEEINIPVANEIKKEEVKIEKIEEKIEEVKEIIEEKKEEIKEEVK